MKMQLGVFVLLLMASIVMQQYLGFELLDTILTLGAVYVIVFWLFNFFKNARWKPGCTRKPTSK